VNCKRFQTDLIDLSRDNAAASQAAERAIAHARSCSRCSAALADQRRLTHGLKALAWNTRSASAPSRTEEHLRAAFRQTAAASDASHSASRHRKVRFRLGVAAAAAVLIALAGSYYRLRSSAGPPLESAPLASANQDVNQVDPTSRSAGPGSAQSGGASSQVTAGPAGGSGAYFGSVRRGRHSRGEATSESSESGTDFVPLIYGSNPTQLEGGQILRVRMSRSALASLGFPLNMDRPEESIIADVMLGEDGLARSIRLVQSSGRSPQD